MLFRLLLLLQLLRYAAVDVNNVVASLSVKMFFISKMVKTLWLLLNVVAVAAAVAVAE